MIIGLDGKPVVEEWGNIKSATTISDSCMRDVYVDEMILKRRNRNEF